MDLCQARLILSAAVGLILLVGTPRRGVRTVWRAIPALKIVRVLFAAVFLLAGGWATQSADGAPPSSRQTIARIHWLGMKQLAGETNAAQLMAILNLPESGRLERQTLDKLSLAPWPWLHRRVDTNAAACLRPLLDDLVADEFYLEIRRATNQPDELVFAIRLDDQRAAFWQTNLARVLESLTDIRPVPAPEGHYGWSLKKHHDPDFLELTRAGEWTIFGAAQEHNDLVGDLLARIRRGQAPLGVGTSNDWFEADVDLANLISVGTSRRDVPVRANADGTVATVNAARTAQFAIPASVRGPWNLPRISLAVTDDGTNVLAHGTADFPGPLALDLKPWNIPTNLIDEPRSSFTLLRGFRPWLESSPAWNDLQIGPPPDQICFWALRGFPMQSYFAAPLPEASNEVARLTDRVLQNQHRWFATNTLAMFGSSKTFNGLDWKGAPFMMPFLRSITVSNQNFICGGGLQNVEVNLASLELPPKVLSQTNLVYYDSEETGLRTEQWIYVGQFARLVLHRAQLPTGEPGVLWLKAIAPKLGDNVTDITQTGPNQLSFTRKSTIGFTGIELNLLADWLESPQFPRGLYTFLAPPPAQP